METIYVDPENYGIDSGKLREMLEVLEKEAELHSISVKYEGKRFLKEPGSLLPWRIPR